MREGLCGGLGRRSLGMIARFGFGRLAILSSFAIIAFELELQEGGGCGRERSVPSRGLVAMHPKQLAWGLKPLAASGKDRSRFP